MDDKLFTSIIEYLGEGSILKDKDTKESQVQWQKLVGKYRLVDGTLCLKDQAYRRILSKSQYYSLIYTFHNDPTAGYLEYKKVLQKFLERYY